MRIMVVSDTHGQSAPLRKALLSQPKAEIVIHLGDGEEDIDEVREEFPKKMFLQVCGNCDWGSKLPISDEFTAEGIKIFYTHGHFYGVKTGYDNLISAAQKKGAKIALFGHTHMAVERYKDGLYIMNPGSLHTKYGTYGIIDITAQGIVLNTIKI